MEASISTSPSSSYNGRVYVCHTNLTTVPNYTCQEFKSFAEAEKQLENDNDSLHMLIYGIPWYFPRIIDGYALQRSIQRRYKVEIKN